MKRLALSVLLLAACGHEHEAPDLASGIADLGDEADLAGADLASETEDLAKGDLPPGADLSSAPDLSPDFGPPPPPVGATLAPGTYHTCAILGSGAVKCWGDGFLGLETTTIPTGLPATFPTVKLGTGRTAVAIVAGWHHTCAILDDASLKCWGSNVYGQLGLGVATIYGDAPGEMGDALPAVPLGAGRTVKQAVAGEDHTCALLDDGTVKCWGANTHGKLGLGDLEDRGDAPGEMGDTLPAVSLGTGRTARAIAAGRDHVCAILDDGSVKCWGRNLGQLGLGDTNDRGDAPGEMGDALPTAPLGTGRTAKAIAAGDNHTCAILDDDSLKCWGTNYYGQLGLADQVYRGDGPGEMGDALPVVTMPVGRKAKRLAIGADHTCVVLDDATARCWGSNTLGELGRGDQNDYGNQSTQTVAALPAIDLGTGRTVMELRCGDSHLCARLDDGTLKCWGWNAWHQLGLGDTNARGDYAGEMGDALPVVGL